MRTKDPKLAALESIDVLAPLSNKHLRALTSSVDQIDLAADQTVITQGSHNRHAYFVVEGSLVIDVDGERIATVNAGSIVGERTAFEQGPTNATVRTATPTRLFAIDHRALLSAADGTQALDSVLRQLADERATRAA